MADNTNPLFSVAGDATGNGNFVGYDVNAHRGQTFDPNNPAEGAKYVAMNYLQRNNLDPNSADWATKAAAGLNALGGKYANVFSVATGSDGTQRLSYGDEAISSGGDSGGGNKGAFTWTSSGGARRVPQKGGSAGINQPLFGAPPTASLPQTAMPTVAAPGLNTATPAPPQQGSLNVNSALQQAAINARM